MSILKQLRLDYHRELGREIVRWSSGGDGGFPNFADGNSKSSVEIARRIAARVGFPKKREGLSGQTVGIRFEQLTCRFIQAAFDALRHLRPGKWEYRTTQTNISQFAQYRHLAELESRLRADRTLAASLGQDYIVKPDVVVLRQPIADAEINSHREVLGADETLAASTMLRAANHAESGPFPLLHASISCKWTIRSDRSQNTRTEALNLLRNRNGRAPHIAAITAEPLPMRIASLALGMGDLDCVYHVCLPELREACEAPPRWEDQLEMLETMISGKRLRDVSDLPFDLLA